MRKGILCRWWQSNGKNWASPLSTTSHQYGWHYALSTVTSELPFLLAITATYFVFRGYHFILLWKPYITLEFSSTHTTMSQSSGSLKDHQVVWPFWLCLSCGTKFWNRNPGRFKNTWAWPCPRASPGWSSISKNICCTNRKCGESVFKNKSVESWCLKTKPPASRYAVASLLYLRLPFSPVML